MSLEVHVSGGDNAAIDLVFIHGWGHHSGVWGELINLLGEQYRVHCIDLPGYGATNNFNQNSWKEEQLLADLVEVAPASAIWVGWSLGGMLATTITAKYPERVRALITLCSNPLFAQRGDWTCAMPRQAFNAFAFALKSLPEVTLGRFQAMAVKGTETSQEDLRNLKAAVSDFPEPSSGALNASLELLEKLDVRPELTSLAVPQLHLLGQMDTLVPQTLKAKLGELNSNARVEILEGAAHAPLISSPQAVAEHMADFIRDVNQT